MRDTRASTCQGSAEDPLHSHQTKYCISFIHSSIITYTNTGTNTSPQLNNSLMFNHILYRTSADTDQRKKILSDIFLLKAIKVHKRTKKYKSLLLIPGIWLHEEDCLMLQLESLHNYCTWRNHPGAWNYCTSFFLTRTIAFKLSTIQLSFGWAYN